MKTSKCYKYYHKKEKSKKNDFIALVFLNNNFYRTLDYIV